MDSTDLRLGWRRLVGPSVSLGFAAAVLVWVVAYITHIPGLGLAGGVKAAALAAALLAAGVGTGRMVGSSWGASAGAGAGLVCGVVSLLMLLSYLVEGEDGGGAGVSPAAAIWIPAFVGACTAIGGVGGWIGARLARTRPAQPAHPTLWACRMAWAAVAAIGALIVTGGAVTSTESGLAVPDWPGTFGRWMVLYPVSQMTGRIFIEHSHRLFGMLVGLASIVLAIQAIAADRGNKRTLFWTVLLVVMVVVQGVMGGAGRVVQQSAYWGLAHGVLAQLTLAVAVVIATGLSPTLRAGEGGADPLDRRRRLAATGLLHSLFLQLLLGAAFRHLHPTGNPGAMHTLWAHAAFSLIVVTFAIGAGFLFWGRQPGEARVRRTLRATGLGLLVSVVLQFVLGWAALTVVLMGKRGDVPTAEQVATAAEVPMGEWLVTTAHHANGALLIGLAACAVVWARRLAAARG